MPLKQQLIRAQIQAHSSRGGAGSRTSLGSRSLKLYRAIWTGVSQAKRQGEKAEDPRTGIQPLNLDFQLTEQALHYKFSMLLPLTALQIYLDEKNYFLS